MDTIYAHNDKHLRFQVREKLKVSRAAFIYSSVIQANVNSSNTDGSFTMANSNSFLGPYEILLIAQENRYLGKFFLFHHRIVCCVYSLESPHRCDSNEYIQHTMIV